MDWPERLSVVAIIAAAAALLTGGIVSAFAFLVCGSMGWTRMVEQVRAQGKPTLSAKGRIAVAAMLAAVGIVFLPIWDHGVNQPVGPSAPVFGKLEAMDACKDGVAARATHPSTVEFPMIDYDFREYADDKSELLMSAKARNGFNLLVTFDVQCTFAEGRLEEIVMSEAGPRP
jgi:amino acid permease